MLNLRIYCNLFVKCSSQNYLNLHFKSSSKIARQCLHSKKNYSILYNIYSLQLAIISLHEFLMIRDHIDFEDIICWFSWKRNDHL